MKKGKYLKNYASPTEFTLAILGGKWKTVILHLLKERSYRYAELRKQLPNLSNKVLTERLTDLIESGLVLKTRAADPGKIEVYGPTDRARSLYNLLDDLYAWGNSHASEFAVDMDDPLKKL